MGTTVTLVQIHLTKPGPGGTEVPANATLLWQRTKRLDLEGSISLPAPFIVRVLAGEAEVELEPTPVDLSWAWHVTERTAGGQKGGRYVSVPDQAEVDYDDLPELNPITLQDDMTPDAAWNVALAALSARVDVIEGGAASLPAGGSEDEVLAKLSSTDGDADWVRVLPVEDLVLLLENAMA